MSTTKAPFNVVFGAMLFGEAGREGARTHSLEEAKQILDAFQRHGHNEVDTARVYTGGQSEQWLGELGWQARGITMATKLYPTKGQGVGKLTREEYTFAPADLRAGSNRSLKELKADSIDIFYLHAPDRSTPIEETLREINSLHKEGKFRRFGLSNYPAWDVAQICELADRNGWVKPAVYQGVYNAWHRAIELDLMPCLRHYGISFYVFSPLAGGFLTEDINAIKARYMNEPFFQALDILKPVAEKYDLTMAECAMRWLGHHSMLKKEPGDAVIIGASSLKHTEENLQDLEKGPLPDEVVQALDAGWAATKGIAQPYFR